MWVVVDCWRNILISLKMPEPGFLSVMAFSSVDLPIKCLCNIKTAGSFVC